MSELKPEQILADTIKDTINQSLKENIENENSKKISTLEEALKLKDNKIEELSSIVQQSKVAIEVLQNTNSSMDAKFNISKNSGDIDISKINKLKSTIVREGVNEASSTKRQAEIDIKNFASNIFKNFNNQDLDFITQSVSSGIVNLDYNSPVINLSPIKVLEEKPSFVSTLVNRASFQGANTTINGTMVEDVIASTDQPTTIIEGGVGNLSNFGSSSQYSRQSSVISVGSSISNFAVWNQMEDAFIADIYDRMLTQIEINRSKSILNGYYYTLNNQNQSYLTYNNSNQGIEGILSLANNPINKDGIFSRGIAKYGLGTVSEGVITITYQDLDNLLAVFPSEATPDLILPESLFMSFLRQKQDTGDLNFDQYFQYDINTGRLFYKSKGLFKVIVVPTYSTNDKQLVDSNNMTGLSARMPLMKQRGFENYNSLNPLTPTTIIQNGFQQGGTVANEAGKIVAMAGVLKEAYTLHTSSWIAFDVDSNFNTHNTGRKGIRMSTSHAGIVNDIYKIAIGYAKAS